MKTQFEELTDSQWEVIKDLFPEQVLCTLSLRTVLDAIFWLLRTGTQWRNLDSKYPDYNAVYHHYRKWKNDGRFEQMNHRLVQMEREKVGKEATPSVLSVDSQSVKVAPFIDQDKGIDGGKRVNGRKRHIFTDTLGLVWGVLVGAANLNDGKEGIKLFGEIRTYFERLEKVLADGTYKGSFEEFVADVSEANVEIASRPPTQRGFVPIKIRWTVERTFGWFNFFRRLAKDFEKTVESSATWILLANSKIILNRIQP
ncbi:MAG: IS5 family transposase [Bacteroidota bacterium]